MDENCSDDSIGCSSDQDHDDHDLDDVPVTMYTASGELFVDRMIQM